MFPVLVVLFLPSTPQTLLFDFSDGAWRQPAPKIKFLHRFNKAPCKRGSCHAFVWFVIFVGIGEVQSTAMKLEETKQASVSAPLA